MEAVLDGYRFEKSRSLYLRKYLTGLHLFAVVKIRPLAAFVVFIDGVEDRHPSKQLNPEERSADCVLSGLSCVALKVGKFHMLYGGLWHVDRPERAMIESLGSNLRI